MRGGRFDQWRRRLRRPYKNRPGPLPWILSLPARFGLMVFRMLPPLFAVGVVDRVGRLMWWIPARRRIGDANLHQAFPDMDRRERARIGRASCGMMARNVGEPLLIGARLGPEDLEGFADFEPGARELLRSPRGRGAVFVQGHYGSMEAMDGLIGSYGLRLLTVVRLPYNHYLARALVAGREGWGVDLTRRDGALKKMLSRLAEGGAVMLPMDVNAHRGAIFVPWFGRLAATEPAAAWLAVRTGRPLIVCWGMRSRRPRRWEVGATLVRPESPPHKPTDEELHDVTLRIHAALEAVIRRYPEQYFWIHDRYRTRPPEEGGAAGGTAGGR